MKPRLYLAILLIGVAGCASQRPAPVQELGPARAAPQAPGAGPEFYTVKPGDTLFGIARGHGMDLRQLSLLNNLDQYAALQSGQVLRLRPPAPPAATTAPATPQEPEIQINQAESPAPIEAHPLEAGPGAPMASPTAPGVAGTPGAAEAAGAGAAAAGAGAPAPGAGAPAPAAGCSS